jgi:hypothetical protein
MLFARKAYGPLSAGILMVCGGQYAKNAVRYGLAKNTIPTLTTTLTFD